MGTPLSHSHPFHFLTEKHYLKEIIIILSIAIFLFFIFIILGSMYDWEPFFYKRKMIQHPNNVFLNEFDKIQNFPLTSANAVLRLQGTSPPQTRRYFYAYDYILEYQPEQGPIQTLSSKGNWTLFKDGIVNGTIFDVIILLNIFNIFPETVFKLTLSRRIGFSNLNQSNTPTFLDETNGEIIVHVVSETILLNQVNVVDEVMYHVDSI